MTHGLPAVTPCVTIPIGEAGEMTATRPTAGRGDVRQLWLRWEGQYIRSLRRAAGMTQTELAAGVGFNHKQSVSQIETGKLHTPPTHAGAFAKALGVGSRDFGIHLLRWQNPWLFSMIFGDDCQLRSELQRAVQPEADY